MKTVLFLCFCCFIVHLTTASDAVAFSILVTSLLPSRLLANAYSMDSQESSEEISIDITAKPKNITTESDTAKLRRFYLECIEETHVKPDLVRKLRAGKWGLDHPSLKKWTLCVLNKMDLMSRQGVYRYDTAMSKIRDEDKYLVDKIINRCLSKKAKPPHEIAWDYLKCLNKRDRKQNFPSLGIFYKIK